MRFIKHKSSRISSGYRIGVYGLLMLGSLLAGKPLLLMLAQSALSSMDAVERAQKDFHVKVVAKRDTA